MSVKSVALITVGVLSASTALSAGKKELHGNHSALILNEEGDLSWRPSIHGLNKYTISLPKEGITRALQYQDTSELFYLSEISERALNIGSPNRLRADLILAPNLSYLDINWPISKVSYGGIKFDYNDANKLLPSISGHMIAASTPYSFHKLGFSYGDKVELSASGVILNLGETSEQFYTAYASSSKITGYKFSYGQRTWNTFGEFDTTWVAGVTNDSHFVSLQLERDTQKGFLFTRLTAQSGTQPRLNLGIQHTLSKPKFGSWRLMASTIKRSSFAKIGPTLAAHRRRSLPNLWRPTVIIEALRSAKQAQ